MSIFTPTYGSWLNLVERWFAELTNKQLRRGVHRSVAQLKAAIREFIDTHHADLKPFIWTKTADQILESIARFAQRTLEFQAAPLIARTTRTGLARLAACGESQAPVPKLTRQRSSDVRFSSSATSHVTRRPHVDRRAPGEGRRCVRPQFQERHASQLRESAGAAAVRVCRGRAAERPAPRR